MEECNWVIANIPVRKGLEERYCVHVNVATDRVEKNGAVLSCEERY